MTADERQNFLELINSGKSIIGYTFDFFKEENIIDESLITTNLIHFKDCIFNKNELVFQGLNNKNLSISFQHCEFNCEINFYNCKIKNLMFFDIKKITKIDIRTLGNDFCEFDTFSFINGFSENPIYKLNGDISIRKCIFKNLRIEKIKQINGSFSFIYNITDKAISDDYIEWKFNDCQLSFANFTNNRFDKKVSFRNVFFYNNVLINNKNEIEPNKGHPLFLNNYFENVSFTNSQFIKLSEFISCHFNSRADFSNLKNHEDGILLFSDCDFNGVTYFNDCVLNILNFSQCSFKKTTSFNNSKLNKLFFIQVKFDNVAYFDYTQINSLLNNSYLQSNQIRYWKITIRTIKQELQKTENRIDYNRFKSYEMATYFKELSWKNNFMDKSILYMTKLSTDFGNSWTKALIFTLLIALFFFSIFFISENYNNSFDIGNWQDFAKGYIRFFLITDFYSPLEEGRTYIKSFWSWIPFIFGKIFIAFGIYEMIQSFRKFKV
ncbi:hypothetical protein FIA58_013475 [Flavobacterium jejuense]|uniref:Pentapeptide repeat-containing protein n=1 Tax=Flavobacterium jejuense TaxID=1544455 RepID=A0ABX0IS56_9FLAO|nr:pentapeptide repeat-containing protein [Flavobacterium jejuense]NHN26690.1 hypothetical protein [Flavobacterium jejuense]